MVRQMTPRERVLTALDHQEPDRVPIFFGVNSPTTMLAPAYDAFKDYLGIESETRLFSRAFQYCRIDEEVMERFGSDARPLSAGAPPSKLRRDLGPDRFIDEWGINWYQAPGSIYYETTNAPLRGATIADLDTFSWPALAHPSRFSGLQAEARRMHEETPYAVVALGYLSTFETCTLLRGLDTLLMDCAANPDFVHALMRRVTDLMIEGVIPYLEAVGEYIDLITMADDMGTQTSLLISPKMYRALVKPYQAELVAAIKERTKAKLMLHENGRRMPRPVAGDESAKVAKLRSTES
jgi:uroporphyrinogen decarboxylase